MSLKISHTPGEWDATFQQQVEHLFDDMLSDGPAIKNVTLRWEGLGGPRVSRGDVDNGGPGFIVIFYVDNYGQEIRERVPLGMITSVEVA